MKKSRYLFVLSLCYFHAISAQQSVPADSISRLLAHQFERMEQTLLSEHPEEVSAFYTGDALIVGNKTRVKGRAQIRAYWNGMKDRAISWTLEEKELLVFEHVLVQTGTSDLEYLDFEGEPMHSVVRFTLVWTRTSDGWKIKLDHYSPI